MDERLIKPDTSRRCSGLLAASSASSSSRRSWHARCSVSMTGAGWGAMRESAFMTYSRETW
ncbi:hypothetical protein VR46_41080, partial [Streptomyces sp. NRRL S-444]